MLLVENEGTVKSRRNVLTTRWWEEESRIGVINFFPVCVKSFSFLIRRGKSIKPWLFWLYCALFIQFKYTPETAGFFENGLCTPKMFHFLSCQWQLEHKTISKGKILNPQWIRSTLKKRLKKKGCEMEHWDLFWLRAFFPSRSYTSPHTLGGSRWGQWFRECRRRKGPREIENKD